MKRRFASVLAILLSALALTACEPNLKLFGLDDPNDYNPSEDIHTDDDIVPEKREYVYKGENALNHLGSDTGTIRFQTGGSSAEKALWDSLIYDFQQSNPGITVKSVNIDKNDILQAGLEARTAPDVIQVDSSVFGAWAQKGWFQSIQPFINGEVDGIEPLDTSIYYPQTMQMFKLSPVTGVRGEGEIFGLPKDFGVQGIFVNRELVVDRYNRGAFSSYPGGQDDYAKLMAQEQLTFEEYFRIAHHLTYNCVINGEGKHEHNGYWQDNVYGANRIHWEAFLWGLGSDILTDDYKLNIEDEYVQYVFEQCRNQVTKGSASFYSLYSDTGATDSGTAFTGRRLCMYMGGRWNVSTFDSSFVATSKNPAESKYFCIPVPVYKVKNGKPVRAPIASCSTVCYAISRNCQNTKMAYKLIRYLASREGYRTMNTLNYAVPGIRDLKNENEFKDPMKYNSPYYGGFGNVICNLDEKSASTFFDMADEARISNACRFTNDNWIVTFETGLNLFLQDTGKTRFPTSYDFLKSVYKSVNSAIKKSDPQLFW